MIPPLSMSASLRLPIINRFLADIRPMSVLEVGSGLGAMAYRLAQCYQYRGYEPDPRSYSVAAERLALLGRGEIRNETLPSEPDTKFDVLVAFEVLEHMADDLAALSGWVDWLHPGGSVVLSVPAGPSRFGAWDEHVGHYRRYNRSNLEAVFGDAGLELVAAETWGMPVGYLLEEVRNRAARRKLSSGDHSQRTLTSGRLLQPPPWLGAVNEIAMKPFALVQALFHGTDHGIGLVVRGQRAS